MNKFIQFVDKYLWVFSIIIFCVAAAILCIVLSEHNAGRVMFLFGVTLLWLVLVACNRPDQEFYRFNTKWGIFYCVLLLLTLSIMWLFDINLFWSLMPFALSLLMLSKGAGWLFTIIYIAGLGFTSFMFEGLRAEKAYIESHEKEIAIVESISKMPSGKFKVALEEKGTFLAPAGSNLDLLKKGDTIVVLTRDNQILTLSRK